MSRIKAPVSISRQSLKSRFFDYQSDDDVSDVDDVDFYERGTVSDQELMPESDLLSGIEEPGYEVF